MQNCRVEIAPCFYWADVSFRSTALQQKHYRPAEIGSGSILTDDEKNKFLYKIWNISKIKKIRLRPIIIQHETYQ